MKRRNSAVTPVLFGAPARWSDRDKCWVWHVSPLIARAYQAPTGGWWIAGSINSFHVGSRVHHALSRATLELESHLVAVHGKLGRLIARKGAA